MPASEYIVTGLRALAKQNYSEARQAFEVEYWETPAATTDAEPLGKTTTDHQVKVLLLRAIVERAELPEGSWAKTFAEASRRGGFDPYNLPQSSLSEEVKSTVRLLTVDDLFFTEDLAVWLKSRL